MFVLVQLQQLDIFQDFESNNFLQKESPIPENSSGGKDVAERNVEGEKEGRSLGVVAGFLMFSVKLIGVIILVMKLFGKMK